MPAPWTPRSELADPFNLGQPDLIALFETMAHGHPEWLLDKADGLPKELARPARFAAAGIMAQQDSAGFLQWALAQPDRNELVNRINGSQDPLRSSHRRHGRSVAGRSSAAREER